MEFDEQTLIRALRLSCTCIVLFLLTWYFQVPENAWALITVWFVMFEYTTVGGVVRKGLYRAAGTILSALYGIIIIYFCDNNVVINILALTPAVVIYSYYFMNSEKMYIALIGCVTLTIVLLNYNHIDLAILRAFNIVLGIIISMFMIRFFYPQYAKDRIIVVQSRLIFLLSQNMRNYLDPSLSFEEVKTKYWQYEHDIYLKLSTRNQLFFETKVEGSSPEFIDINKKSFEHIQNIFRLTSLFTNYLPTEEIRSNVWVINNIQWMLSNLHACQIKLEGKSEELSSEPKSLPHAQPSRAKTMFFIRFIVDSLNKEISLLDKEINEIVLIYNHNTGFFKTKFNRDTSYGTKN